ncbi:unnamed protein product [Porites lobata]|uniref:Reverse transcriptase domain-containing protein n=1 Tax=Porites lobata TaxID=104759 RepID=A0ABN8PB58_9CNID|nr:unnamed protein product [Porites lobata]
MPDIVVLELGTNDLPSVAPEVIVSLCLEHWLDWNANAPRARQRLAPLPNGRGEISNPVNLLFFRQFRSADTPVMEIPATIPSTPQCLPSHSLPVLESAMQACHLATQPAVSPSEPSDPFISSSLSLDARVSEKIRAKIWNQEYVDFGSLLINPIRQSRFQLTVSNAESGQLTSLCMEPAEKPRKITSIESWLSAFHVFVGVYTMKYPTESPALMKYGLLIRDLAARGHNWRFYDENFRFINQSHVSSLPWGTIHSELWLRSHSGTSTSKSPGSGEIIIQSTNSLCLPKVKLPTPVQADRLILLLDGYDHSTVEFLRCGFTEGFSIHFNGDLTEIVSKNLLSAIQQPAVVEAKLSKEIDAGRIAGPFKTPPFPKFRVSPLGVVPKKVPCEFRLIHHLSYPKGLLVNDGIPHEYSSVSYANIEDAIRFIKKAGHGCFLAKTDIQSAFRIIPINPKDYHLLGIDLDSLSMKAQLPCDKIHKCTALISQFLWRKKVTLQELQSLLGLPNFARAVVKPGRAFLRRLILRLEYGQPITSFA